MIAHSRRPYTLSVLFVGALTASACSGGSEAEPTATDESNTTVASDAGSATDEFTEVSTVDESVDGEPVSTADESSEDDPPADDDPDTSEDATASGSTVPADVATTAPQTEGTNPPPDTGVATTTVEPNDPDEPADTTPADPAGGSAGDDALAEALTAQLDDDDDDGFGAVFDTACLGRELVVAFGGAEAAESKYDITVESVGVESAVLDTVIFDETDAEAVVAGFGQCGSFDDLLLLTLTGSSGDDAEAQCIVDAIPDGSFESAFAADLQGLENEASLAFEEAIDGAFDDCFL